MRILLEAVVAVLVLTLLRSFIGIILKGFSELLGSPASSASGSGAGARSAGPRAPADELKKDPVCGTFIAASTSIQKSVGGQTYHFCSAECRDKFRTPDLHPGVRKAG